MTLFRMLIARDLTSNLEIHNYRYTAAQEKSFRLHALNVVSSEVDKITSGLRSNLTALTEPQCPLRMEKSFPEL